MINYFSISEALQNEIILSQGFSLESILRGIIGMISLVFIAYLFSSNKKAINWKTTFLGLTSQLILAVLILRVEFVQSIFEFFGKIFVKTLDFTMEGSKFLLGDMVNVESFGYVFLFQVLPTIIFFSALTSVLFYLGIIQKVVKILALSLSKLLNISGAESLSVAGNIFLGQTEAPLMIKAYLEKMNKSEILLVMIGGMATVAGSVMVALISILEVQFENVNLIQHFLTASILSVPAAIMYANIMIPSNEITDSNDESAPKVYSSTMDAITTGTTQGSNIAVSVGTILIAVIALVYIVNAFLGTVGGYFGLNLSIELLLGYIFAPITWLMGIPWNEAVVAGELLGLKTTLNEFVAYPALANLEQGLLSERSKLITFYSLCGFANFSSVGILISGIGAMVPERKNDLIEVSFKALVAATLASCMTGLVVGCFI